MAAYALGTSIVPWYEKPLTNFGLLALGPAASPRLAEPCLACLTNFGLLALGPARPLARRSSPKWRCAAADLAIQSVVTSNAR
jgi:hypothetical protein